MSGQFSIPDDGDEADRVLAMFNALDPANATRDPNVPPGYRAATPSAHGCFFSPADLAKNAALSIPGTLWALPDLSTSESQRLAEQTWLQRAEQVQRYQTELNTVIRDDDEPPSPSGMTITRGD